jgi:hypothetical protein
MILWAIIGLLIGIGFSLEEGCQWPTAFWRGCAAALFAAILARWWTHVWLEGLRDSIRQRQYKRTVPATKPKPNIKT